MTTDKKQWYLDLQIEDFGDGHTKKKFKTMQKLKEDYSEQGYTLHHACKTPSILQFSLIIYDFN